MKTALKFASALCLAAGLLPALAVAQNAANGDALYRRVITPDLPSCATSFCHSSMPRNNVGKLNRGADAQVIKAKIAADNTAAARGPMAPLHGVITDAQLNDIAAYLAGQFGTTPNYIATSSIPSVSVSATSLSFAAQNLNSTSAAQTLTVSNAAAATGALNLTTIATTAGSDFAVSGGSCQAGGSVAVGASCTINVTFTPTATGTRNGSLSIAHNGANGRTDVSLSGTAVNLSPAVSVSPTALTFSSATGTASSPMRVTLSNTGTAALSLSSLTLGGTQASDYTLAASSTCAANGSVAGGSSCVLDVVFTPTVTGARNATLTIAHNAAGSPSVIALSGTGTAVAQPGIALDATTLELGRQVVGMTSAAQTLTLTNTGGAALTLSGISASGNDAGDFVLGGTCATNAAIAARGTCTITVAMRPVTLGNKVATLNVASNAPTGAVRVTLRGTSVRTAEPQVGLSQATLGFGSVTLGVRSMARTVVFTNTGTAPMTVGSITSTSPEFVVTHDCPATLAVNAFCTLSTVYTPVTPNSAESIVITTNALSSPNSVVLTGLGTAAMMPVLAWQPSATALTFASTVVGVSSASQSLTLVNQGPGAVMLNTVGVAGANASSFAIASASTCRAGVSLNANASCTVMVNFVPGTTGPKLASLQVASNGTPPAEIALSGSGASPSTEVGMLTLNQSTLDFSSIGLIAGQTSSPLSVTVSNGSAAAVMLSSVRVSGPFTLVAPTGACATNGLTLAPGASCSVGVVYSPTAAGASTGLITLTTGSNQTLEVTLRGQASAATPRLVWQPASSTLMFSSAMVGASSSQTLTLSNQGPGAAAISALALSGMDASSFSIASASTCRANSSVAAGATCTLNLVFAPGTAGAKSATLRVESNATAPGDVVLAGTGIAANTPNGMLSVDRQQLDFSATNVAVGQTSASMNLVVSNGNVAAVTLSRVEVSGQFRLVNNGCPAATSALGVNATCTLAVAYAPTTAGANSGNLTLTTATNQVIMVSLRGASMAPTPALMWQTGGQSALQFDSTVVGMTTASRSLTLVNQGPGQVTLTAVETDGDDRASFVLASGTTCGNGVTLQQGNTCVIQLSFAPRSAGTKNAGLRIASNGSAPGAMALSGVGRAGDNGGGSPTWAVDREALSFVMARGMPSPGATIRVTNRGTTALVLTNIGTTGPFQVINSPADGCGNPHTLAAGAFCDVSVLFNAPPKEGVSTGALTIPTSTGDTKVVSLSGRSVSMNVGSSAADDERGGGALGIAWLALFGLAVVLSALARRRT